MTAESKALPRKVVEQDRSLRGAEARAGRGLAELRWHWTRNEGNPRRLSYAEYGRQTGVDGSTIRSDARAWEILMDPSVKFSLTDARRLAHMSADRGEAFQALANVTTRIRSETGRPRPRPAAGGRTDRNEGKITELTADELRTGGTE